MTRRRRSRSASPPSYGTPAPPRSPERPIDQTACAKVRSSRNRRARISATVPYVCGIVGYAGARPALPIVIDGLRRLEYRGYDSAGVAVVDGGRLLTEKRAGKLANLEKAVATSGAREPLHAGTTGVGHT